MLGAFGESYWIVKGEKQENVFIFVPMKLTRLKPILEITYPR